MYSSSGWLLPEYLVKSRIFREGWQVYLGHKVSCAGLIFSSCHWGDVSTFYFQHMICLHFCFVHRLAFLLCIAGTVQCTVKGSMQVFVTWPLGTFCNRDCNEGLYWMMLDNNGSYKRGSNRSEQYLKEKLFFQENNQTIFF